MKTVIIILTFYLLAALNVGGDKNIDEFVKTTQLNDFEIIQNSKSEIFVHSIESLQLHNNKNEILLKAKKPHSNKYSYNEWVYTRIQLWQFDFETKEKCKQAIDSLFNCFPYNCDKIQRHINKAMKITPSIWIFNDKRIVIAKTACEQVGPKWMEFKRDFVEYFADDEMKIIVSECGKLVWKTKKEITGSIE